MFSDPAGEEEVMKINMALAERKDYTADDADEMFADEQRVEIIDGQIFLLASPKAVHEEIRRELEYELVSHIKKNGGRCKLYANLDIYLDNDDKTRVEPDMYVVCDRSKIREDACYGAPDLIIEIVSRSTRSRDYGLKLLKYRTAGVREYWIVNPYTETVSVYWFEDENQNCQYSFNEEIAFHLFPELAVRIADMLS